VTKTPLRSVARLLRGGLTLSEIERLDDVEMLAYDIAMGECEGGEFDWENMRWREGSK